MTNFQTGNFKQKNKPFKGKSKQKNKFKGLSLHAVTTKRVKKRIQKQARPEISSNQKKIQKIGKKQSLRATRRQHNKERREKNIHLNLQNKRRIISQSQVLEENMKQILLKSIKNMKNTKIIAVLDCNNCGLSEIMMEIQKKFNGRNSADRLNLEGVVSTRSVSSNFEYLHVSGEQSGFSQLSKQNFLFISCERQLFSVLDLFKVADLVMPVTSLKKIDFSILNTNPKDALNVIDDFALDTIVWLRSQGILPAQPVILDINSVPKNKKKNVKFYVDRLFKEEFDTKNSAQFIEKPNDLLLMMLKLANVKEIPMVWRDSRGYLLVEKVTIDQNKVVLQGEARGAGFSLNELVHITGIGDFAPSELTFEVGKGHNKAQAKFACESPDPMQIFADEINQNVNEKEQEDQMGLELENNEEAADLQDELDMLNQQISNMKMAGFEFEENPYIVPEKIENNEDDD